MCRRLSTFPSYLVLGEAIVSHFSLNYSQAFATITNNKQTSADQIKSANSIQIEKYQSI